MAPISASPRRRTFALLGGGTTVAITATAVLSGALGVVGGSPMAPPAAAGELVRFPDCDELRQWYVDTALPLVGPWGLGGPPVHPAAEQAAAGDRAVANGPTGTNVQEAGVDEPDVAKTDGALVAHLADGHLLLTDVSTRPREISRLPLPEALPDPELLLSGDTVTVIGHESHGYLPTTAAVPDRMLPVPTQTATLVLTVDITDPGSPRVVRRDRYAASLVSARSHEDVVRVVLSNDRPVLDFVTPDVRRTPAQARRENRSIVRDSEIGDWLPTVRSGGDETALLDCSQVRRPTVGSGLGTLSVVTFRADSPADRTATAVTAAGNLVYSSTTRLYLATTPGGWWPMFVERAAREAPGTQPSTQVHAFALENGDTTYLASGEVPGTVRDRWSMSEHDGNLRVATALGPDPWEPTENAVVVLTEDGDRLVEVGRVGRMGLGEDIQSVRWFGDLAVVVTFRQVDPLYTVDLSDPGAPQVLGELKVPGFSSYLHPVGGGRLLGLGQDATLDGLTLGGQASVFDVRDLRHPRRVDTVHFGRDTAPVPAADPRTFTYLPEQRTALVPVEEYGTGTARLAVLRIADDGTLTPGTVVRVPVHAAYSVRTLPLGDGEVAVVAGTEVTRLQVGAIPAER